MPEPLEDVLLRVTDEKSFIEFLRELAADFHRPPEKVFDGSEWIEIVRWTNKSVPQFLLGGAAWGSGDFVEGEHGGEPLLRRVATLLYAARYSNLD